MWTFQSSPKETEPTGAPVERRAKPGSGARYLCLHSAGENFVHGHPCCQGGLETVEGHMDIDGPLAASVTIAFAHQLKIWDVLRPVTIKAITTNHWHRMLVNETYTKTTKPKFFPKTWRRTNRNEMISSRKEQRSATEMCQMSTQKMFSRFRWMGNWRIWTQFLLGMKLLWLVFLNTHTQAHTQTHILLKWELTSVIRL